MRRLWFVLANTTQIWYLNTDAISGAGTVLDVGPFLTKGGYVEAVGTWTIDGAYGPQALLVIMSSEGQVVIYSGQDPTNSTTWTIVGVFNLAKPIGRRCMLPIGNELGLITVEGLIPISKALPFNPAALRSVSITNVIQNAMNQSSQNYYTNFGWEAILFPMQTLLIMNIPTSENVAQIQYVMNTITNTWSSFSGWNANCFALYNQSLYFGDNLGNVNIAYIGRLDGTNSIVATSQSAFNFFETPGRNKHLSFVKPYLVSDGVITPSLGVAIDFGTAVVSSPVTAVSPTGAAWDAGTWDSSTWGGGNKVLANWQSVQALGTALSLILSVNYGTSSSSLRKYGFFDVGVFDSATFDGTGYINNSGEGVPVLQLTEYLGMLQFGGPV